jgi:hypothetical protein
MADNNPQQKKTETPAKPEKTIVFSRFDSVHTIAVQRHTKVDGKAVIIALPNIVLLPGVNEVDTAAWEAVAEDSKHTIMQHYLKAKRLKSDNGPFLEVLDGSLSDLSSQDVEAALDLIQNTGRPELLKRWKIAETRSEVVDAIEDQLKQISVTKE